MNKDSLGDRIKENYENAFRIKLPRRMPIMIRCDGKAFHTLTKDMKRPFDEAMTESMIYTTKFLCENVQNCVLGYTQSDEISLLLIDYKKFDTEGWFDNNLQKMVSISAALATIAFNKKMKQFYPNKEGIFDSRAYVLPREEVNNAYLWRQQDCSRNSIQSLAQANFSHKSLQNLNTSQLQDKLMLEKKINWNDLSTVLKRGTCVKKVNGVWIPDLEIPIFSQNTDYINDLLLPDET